MTKKLLSLILALTLCVQMVPAVFADSEDGLCPHHTAHDEYCGYAESTDGSPCTHEHDDSCYTVIELCIHEHDGECGYDEETDSGCAHVCSEESGCHTKELVCEHEHDEYCGYVEATEASPCEYACLICNPAEDKQEEKSEDVEKPAETASPDAEAEKSEQSELSATDTVNPAEYISSLPPYEHDPSIAVYQSDYLDSIRVAGSFEEQYLYNNSLQPNVLPADFPLVTSLEEAANFFREAFSTRMVLSCEVALAADYQVNDQFYADLWEQIWVETGNPKQGDYLRYNTANMRNSAGIGVLNGESVQIVGLEMSYQSSMDDPDLAREREAELAEWVDGFVKDYRGKTSFEIIKGVHDYICTNIPYDTVGVDTDTSITRDSSPYSAWKGISQGTFVCNGYATLYYYILRTLGVNVRCVSNTDHLWNIVELGGKWYLVDTTWDEIASPGKQPEELIEYFLKGGPDPNNIADHTGLEERFLSEAFLAAHPIAESDYSTDEPGTEKPKLQTPVLLDAFIVGDGISVKWRNVSGAAKYRVYYKSSDDKAWIQAGDVDPDEGDETSATVEDLASGKLYSFTVQCLNAKGKALSEYNPVGISVNYPANVLPTPIITGLSAKEDGVEVNWDAIEGVNSYRPMYRLATSSVWMSLSNSPETTCILPLLHGRRYAIAVVALDNEGNVASGYRERFITYRAAPELTGLTVLTKGDKLNGVKLSWNSPPAETADSFKYVVLYKETGSEDWDTYGTTTDTSCVVKTGLTKGKSYSFTVLCADSEDNFISPYNSKGLSIKYDFLEHHFPVLKEIEANSNGITLKWYPVKGVSAYRVYIKGTDIGDDWTTDRIDNLWVVTDGKTSFDTSAENVNVPLRSANLYHFTVECVQASYIDDELLYVPISGKDPVGKSAVFKKLPAPELISVAEDEGADTATVRWKPVASEHPNEVLYRVLYRHMGDEEWQSFISQIPPQSKEMSAKLENLTLGNYEFTVVCVDSKGNFVSDYNVNGLSLSYKILPEPKLVSAVSTPEGVKVTWKAVEGAPKYLVKYKPADAKDFQTESTTETSYTVTGLEAGVEYGFTVMAADNNEYPLSGYETPINVIFKPLAVPKLVSAVSKRNGIELSWEAVEGADKYLVFYKTSDMKAWDGLEYSTGTSYTAKGLTPGAEYSFTVCCADNEGYQISEYDQKGLTTIFFPLAAPEILSLKNTSDGVKLTWNAVEGAAKYAILCRPASSKQWTMDGGTATEPVCTVTGLTPNTSYFFTVACTDEDGYHISPYDNIGKRIKYVPVTGVELVDCPEGITQVFVDGDEVTLTDGFIPMAEAEKASTVTLFTYSGSNEPYNGSKDYRDYPVSMKVWTLEEVDGVITAVPQLSLDNILLYHGTSVRVPNYGVRVISSIPTALKAEGIDGFKLIEYGTQAMGAASGKVINAKAFRLGELDTELKRVGDRVQFTNALVDMSTADDCRKELYLRSYVIIEKDGVQHTIYGGWINRSILYVATQNKDAFPEGSEYDKFIEKIISYGE